jgi:hypothetical protein
VLFFFFFQFFLSRVGVDDRDVFGERDVVRDELRLFLDDVAVDDGFDFVLAFEFRSERRISVKRVSRCGFVGATVAGGRVERFDRFSRFDFFERIGLFDLATRGAAVAVMLDELPVLTVGCNSRPFPRRALSFWSTRSATSGEGSVIAAAREAAAFCFLIRSCSLRVAIVARVSVAVSIKAVVARVRIEVMVVLSAVNMYCRKLLKTSVVEFFDISIGAAAEAELDDEEELDDDEAAAAMGLETASDRIVVLIPEICREDNGMHPIDRAASKRDL